MEYYKNPVKRAIGHHKNTVEDRINSLLLGKKKMSLRNHKFTWPSKSNITREDNNQLPFEKLISY
jgi:hypothetical protein